MFKTLKKIVIGAVLIAVFCLLAGVIIRPLLAEVSFGKAQRLVAEYKWTRASPKFEEAIRLDPFNARYYAGLGDFLLRQARYKDDKMPFFEKAEGLYKKAAELDPRNAIYWVRAGKVAIWANTKEAFRYFKKAVENDPNGFRVNYETGYAGIAGWKGLNEDERAFIVERLKKMFEARPWGYKNVYSGIWKASADFKYLKAATPGNLKGVKELYKFLNNNGLWQFMAEERNMIKYYRQKEEPDILAKETKAKEERIERLKRLMIPPGAWKGSSADGKHAYKNGTMHWNGTIDTVIDLMEGDSVIKIQAKGTPANGVYPYMIVELDGEEIGDAYVDSMEWKGYEFKAQGQAGARVLSVTFINDGSNREKKEDRNLFIGEVKIQ